MASTFSRTELVRQIALWTAKRKFRLIRWQRLVKTRPVGDPERERYFRLYKSADTALKWRKTALSKLPITSLDTDGIIAIRMEEGFRTVPYNDSAGHCTVGVGHLIHRGKCSTTDLSKWTLTSHEVDALLAKDLARFERTVSKAFAAPGALHLTQPRFNAAVSLAFNIGESGFASSTVARMIRAGKLQEAADAFLLWNKPPELLPRRRRERKMFLRAG